MPASAPIPAIAPAPVSSEAETRERLLDAAEPLFALHGFRDTAVRQITAAAGTNVAAVNYHFGGKDNLYAEMMRRRLEVLRAAQLTAIHSVRESKRPAPTIDRLVRALVESCFTPVASGDRELLVRLFFREMVERHLPAEVWREAASEVEEAFVVALSGLAPRLSAEVGRQCLHSIHDQLSGMFQRAEFEGTAIDGRVGGVPFEVAAEHVIRFSTAGIKACAKG